MARTMVRYRIKSDAVQDFMLRVPTADQSLLEREVVALHRRRNKFYRRSATAYQDPVYTLIAMGLLSHEDD